MKETKDIRSFLFFCMYVCFPTRHFVLLDCRGLIIIIFYLESTTVIWNQFASSTFRQSLFIVKMEWYVSSLLSFDDCSWNKELDIMEMDEEEANHTAKERVIWYTNCAISDVELVLVFKLFQWKVNMLKCGVQNSFEVKLKGSVRFQVEKSFVENAHLTVSALPIVKDLILSEVFLKNTKLISTALNVIEVPKLEIVDSRFINLKATVRGKRRSIVGIQNSFFEDTQPSITQISKSSDCISSQKNYFSLKNVELEVSYSTFLMNCILERGFIQWEDSNRTKHNKLTLRHTIFDAKILNVTQPLFLTPFGDEAICVHNVTVKSKAQAKYEKIGINWELQSIAKCGRGHYRIEKRKSAEISVRQNRNGKLKTRNIFTPCVSCPIGADCSEDTPLPLPNYWGYKLKSGKIKMVRCPEEYCCKGDEDCQSLKSCAKKRYGILCGRCKTNTAQSLFSAACVPVEQCQTTLVVLFCVLAALGYALFLLLYQGIKKAAFQKLKDFWKMVKNKLAKKNTKDKSQLTKLWIEELDLHTNRKGELEFSEFPGKQLLDLRHQDQATRHIPSSTVTHTVSRMPENLPRQRKWKSLESVNLTQQQPITNSYPKLVKEENENERDGGMKYLQILLYFVQDAALFKVHLPDARLNYEDKSLLIQFLQFSPQMLLLYVKVTNLCLVSTTTAVLKVAFRALFGPCILLLLFLMYVGQLLLSAFVHKNSKIWETARAKLCEAFILTILFSNQKIVQGAFELVKCVEISDTKRLFIQADITCFTWWQTAIEAYLCLCIVPVFLFLAVGPFFIKKKQLSVSLFQIGCLFPLPLLLYLIILKVREMSRCVGSSKISKYDASLEIGLHGTETKKGIEYTSSEEALMETLLKHYKTMKICGLSMTWLVFLKLYRMALVWCSTYITEPFPRLCVMNVLVVVMAVVTSLVKPYKEQTANMAAFFSYIASLFIAIINISKSALVAGVYQSNSPVKSLTTYLDLCDTILMTWVPVVAIALWILHSMWTLITAKL